MAAEIVSRQEAILKEMEILVGQRAAMIDHIMFLGKRSPGLSQEEKKEAHLVAGCLSRVWLLPHYREGKLFFRGDSDALLTRGLLSLLLRVLSGHAAEDIIQGELFFIEQLGLDRLLSEQRKRGVYAMLEQIRVLAGIYGADKRG